MVFQFELTDGGKRNPIYSLFEMILTGSTVETADVGSASSSGIDEKPVVAELKNSFGDGYYIHDT